MASLHEFSLPRDRSMRGAFSLRDGHGSLLQDFDDDAEDDAASTAHSAGGHLQQSDEYSVDGLDHVESGALTKRLAVLPAAAQAPRLARVWLVATFIGCGVCWGSSFLFITKCLPVLDPCTIALSRCIFAFALLFSIQLSLMYLPCIGTSADRARQRSEFVRTISSPQALFQMCVLGLCFSAVSGTLIAVSETHVSGGVTGIILMTEPLMAPFIAKAVLPANRNAEPITKFTIGGLLLGMAGTAVSAVPTVSGSDSHQGLALAACFAASLLFSIGTVAGQYFNSRRPVLHRVCGQFFFAGLVLVPTTMILRSQGVFEQSGTALSPLPGATGMTWFWVLALSFGPTVGAWGLFYILMRELGSMAASVNFLIPVTSLLLGAVFNGEWDHLSGQSRALQIVGMVVVLVGVGFVLYATREHERELEAAETAKQTTSGDQYSSNEMHPATASKSAAIAHSKTLNYDAQPPVSRATSARLPVSSSSFSIDANRSLLRNAADSSVF